MKEKRRRMKNREGLLVQIEGLKNKSKIKYEIIRIIWIIHYLLDGTLSSHRWGGFSVIFNFYTRSYKQWVSKNSILRMRENELVPSHVLNGLHFSQNPMLHLNLKEKKNLNSSAPKTSDCMNKNLIFSNFYVQSPMSIRWARNQNHWQVKRICLLEETAPLWPCWCFACRNFSSSWRLLVSHIWLYFRE